MQNKNKYEKVQLDHTSKQYTRGQLSTFKSMSMRCRTEQPRTHARTHARTIGKSYVWPVPMPDNEAYLTSLPLVRT